MPEVAVEQLKKGLPLQLLLGLQSSKRAHLGFALQPCIKILYPHNQAALCGPPTTSPHCREKQFSQEDPVSEGILVIDQENLFWEFRET